jgi:hypothetical protein
VGQTFILMVLLFLMAMTSGLLTWISKNVWRSRTRTGIFAAIGVLSTLGFFAMAMVILP